MKTAILCILFLADTALASDCISARRVRVATVVVGHDYGHHALTVDYTRHGNYSVGGGAISEDLLKAAIDRGDKAKDELAAEYKARAERAERALAGSPDAPPTLKSVLTPPDPGLGVLVTNCASCHDVSTKASGGGFAWLKAGVLIDEGENVNRVFTVLKTGKMGRREMPKLSWEERGKAGFYVASIEPGEGKVEAKGMPPAK